jgi:hypothetical protein
MRSKLTRVMAEYENGQGPMNAAMQTPMQSAMQGGDSGEGMGGGGMQAQQPAGAGSVTESVGNGLQNAGLFMMGLDNPTALASMASMKNHQLAADRDQFSLVPGKDNTIYKINKRDGSVSIQSRGDPNYEANKAADVENMKGVNQLNQTMPADAAKAQGNIGKLDQLKALLSNPNVYQGTGGEYVGDIKKLGASFGINVEGATNVDAIRAMSREMALQARNPAGGAGMPGALSDSDRQFLASMQPSLANTPEGNAQIIDAYQKVHQRTLDIERLRQQYVSRNGRLDMNFYKAVSDFGAQNPLFPAPSQGQPQQQQPATGGYKVLSVQ